MNDTGRWRLPRRPTWWRPWRPPWTSTSAEGGRLGRLARYESNCARLLAGLAVLGLEPFLPRALQAPVIVTVARPVTPGYAFPELYERVKASGFILYPGKLTELETFRVGCIGAIGSAEIDGALAAIGQALRAMFSETQPVQR